MGTHPPRSTCHRYCRHCWCIAHSLVVLKHRYIHKFHTYEVRSQAQSSQQTQGSAHRLTPRTRTQVSAHRHNPRNRVVNIHTSTPHVGGSAHGLIPPRHTQDVEGSETHGPILTILGTHSPPSSTPGTHSPPGSTHIGGSAHGLSPPNTTPSYRKMWCNNLRTKPLRFSPSGNVFVKRSDSLSWVFT